MVSKKSTADSRAVQLLRFSPRPQEDDIRSLAVQAECNERYAKTFDLNIVETFRDEFTSARKVPLDKRKGGAEMLAYIREHKIRHVIFMTVARVFRNNEDGHRWRRKFRKMGVTMHFSGEGGVMFNADTAFGEATFALALMMAAFEPKQTAERTSKGMKYRQRHGDRMSSRLPFGYRVVGQRTIMVRGKEKVVDVTAECPEEQALGERMHYLHNVCGMSLRKTAAECNASCLQFRGKPVTKSAVSAWLRHSSSSSVCSS